MAAYIVKQPLKRNGATYAVGAALDISAAEAAELVACGAVAAAPAKTAAAKTADAKGTGK